VEKVFVSSLRFYRGWWCMIILAIAVIAARPTSLLQPFDTKMLIYFHF
jgi:hypothetical protein